MEENREKRACFSAMEKCMEEKYEKIRLFLNACDELIRGSFVFAEKKIPEVLKALAESGELCELFSIPEVRFIKADGLDIWGNDPEKIIRETAERI